MTKTNANVHDWDSYGIGWKPETVGKGTGASYVAYNTPAQIPYVSDYDKFVDHFSKGVVLGLVNASNSIRVRAQAVNRTNLENGTKDIDTLRIAVYNAMIGVRGHATPITVTVNVYTLPDGTTYEGTDEAEYQGLYAAALIDQGVPSDVAMTIAKVQKIG